ncbi:MAG: anthranilate synthase/aminodeoxychorismate synthase-like glutamine amidotransferase [Chlamydiales bacterium]|jgi:anthranilate synthase/aminodeoxychorismate synthase-like glutamine amidotransferase
MILLIDNYDSFVYNLGRYVGELGYERVVVRNDEITLDEIAAMGPSHIIISPGPCTPDEAGISLDLIQRFGPSIPILGVCLGHQAIGQAYGGRVIRSKRPLHGRTTMIRHEESSLFQDLESPMEVACYYSLVVESESLPCDLIATAHNVEGEIMALRHHKYPVYGLQFHPESILTKRGYDLLRHFLQDAGESKGFDEVQFFEEESHADLVSA